jgi:hypothetical protein
MQEYEQKQKQKQEMQDFARSAVMDTINQMLCIGQISLPSIIDSSSNKKPNGEMMKMMIPLAVAAGTTTKEIFKILVCR